MSPRDQSNSSILVSPRPRIALDDVLPNLTSWPELHSDRSMTEFEKSLWKWFVPKPDATISVVMKALKMQAFVIVTKTSGEKLVMFFEESPLIYDTLFERRGEIPDHIFSEVQSIGLNALRNTGCDISSWVKYLEVGSHWMWTSM